jgi:hypothetical protein
MSESDHMEGGVVAAAHPGITAASRRKIAQERIDDSALDKLLDAVNDFKTRFWAEFLDTKKSQSPQILNEYTTILGQIYKCLVNGIPCPQFTYKNANAAERDLKTLISQLQIEPHQRNYWLRRLLIQAPFALRAT